MLFIHAMLLIYKCETFKNCKEVKLNMIMSLWLSYVMLDQQLKITFRKSSAPPPLPWKNSFPLFYLLPPQKNSNFSPPSPLPHGERRGRTLWRPHVINTSSSSNDLIFASNLNIIYNLHVKLGLSLSRNFCKPESYDI